MKHLALLGDSIFDNAAYVGGGPSVIDQVRGKLPVGWRASLLAVDGNMAGDVFSQIQRLPADVTHLALSVGGNDALGVLGQIHSPTPLPMLHALKVLADVQERFEAQYMKVVDALVGTGKPLLICTIYDRVPGLSNELRSALSLFNDVIVRTGVRGRVPILDLREICTDPADYSTLSPIEPSVVGGDKIAGRMVSIVQNHLSGHRDCVIYR
jgi:hypothetical protein